PSAPYPTDPNTPLYSGQPGGYPGGGYPGGGYPGGPYPGQPYPGGPPGSGYPNPPPMPPLVPPTMPSDVLSSGDGFAARGSGWDSVRVRHAFIRKVYLVLASQLIVTTAIVSVFTFVKPVGDFVRENPALYWVSYAVYFITHIVLVCCTGPRRKHPWNLLLLLLFTLALSYMTGTIASYYDTKVVYLAIAITAIVCICVTVFCFQTKVGGVSSGRCVSRCSACLQTKLFSWKVDFTKCQGLFCVLGIVVFVTGIISAIVLSFKYVSYSSRGSSRFIPDNTTSSLSLGLQVLWLHMLYAALGTIVFTLFLAYHTQLLIGNRKYSISEDEYVFAALSLYVDIIQIFIFLLQIIGA
ncbi:unnamed protein product, partial [Tetraodon nigroviridis]